jgi:hypothetical protein
MYAISWSLACCLLTPISLCLDIVFGNAVVPNVGDSTISIADLNKVGDEQVALLQAALKL